MTKLYVAISAIILAVVAIAHMVRIAQGWEVVVKGADVALSVSWVALIVSAGFGIWGGILLRR